MNILKDKRAGVGKMMKIAAAVSFGIMLAAQLILLIFFCGEQKSDAATYCKLAHTAVDNGVWYPSFLNENNRFIFGNGLVNFLILVFRITDNMRVIYFFNILLVQLLLWSCVYIVKKISDDSNTCYLFITLFCLLNTFWSEVVSVRTEVPFTALAFFSMALLYTDKKYNYFIGGIVMALANWVRPLAIPLILCAVLICVFDKKKIKGLIFTGASFAATIIIIGAVTFAHCGHFVYQATTVGWNLIMSANDKADGSFMDVAAKGNAGYIEPEKAANMSYLDFDKYYTKLSIDWILKNPVKYILQTPKKLFYLYSTETYSGGAYFNNEVVTGGMDYIKDTVKKFKGELGKGLSFGDILICFDQLWYMFIFITACLGLIQSFYKHQWRFALPYLMFVLAGTAMTVVIVGGARYHFPYLPVFMMYASYFINNIIYKNVMKKNPMQTVEV